MATARARIGRLRTDDAPGTGETRLEGHDTTAPTVDADGQTPRLDLDAFTGPLDLLLTLARARRIDIGRIPLADLLGQLAPALRQAVPLAERGGWLVMAAWLVLLRSRLLLPGGAALPTRAARIAAGKQARRLQRQLLGLERVQALAAWLDRQPRLGRDVFGRGMPGEGRLPLGAPPEVDVAALLWACMDLLDGRDGPASPLAYAPQRTVLHSAGAARARILRLIEQSPEPQPLAWFLPKPGLEGELAAWPASQPSAPPSTPDEALLARSGWASTFAASLELAKQGRVTLAQQGRAAPILVIKARRSGTA